MKPETELVQISVRDLIGGEEGELLEEMTGGATLLKASGSIDEIKTKAESLGFEVTNLVADGSVTTWRVHRAGEYNFYQYEITLWSEDASGVTWIPESQLKRYKELFGD